jgi:transposase
LIRSRDALVRSRTLLTPCQHRRCGIGHARSTVKATGARLPSCSADSFHHKVKDSVPEALRPALLPVIDIVASLTEQIRAYDRKVEELSQESYPETQPLRDIGGVGPLTSLAFVLTLEDPGRFRKSRDVGPALGLVPARDQSGDKDPQRHTLAPTLQVQVSPRPATSCCGGFWWGRPTTFWGPSGRTVSCAAGA